MRFRTVIVLGIGCGSIIVAATAGGQSAAPAGSVAVVNLTVVFERVQIAQDLERVFGGRKSEIQAEAETLRRDLRGLQRELDSGAFAKGSADHQDRVQRLDRKEVELQLFLRHNERSLGEQHKQWFADVYKRVTQACREIAQAAGIDVVLSDNPVNFEVPDASGLIGQFLQKQVVYASPRLDLTGQVIERVDQEYLSQGGPTLIELAK